MNLIDLSIIDDLQTAISDMGKQIKQLDQRLQNLEAKGFESDLELLTNDDPFN